MRRYLRAWVPLLALLVAVRISWGGAARGGANWNQWRGPNRDGKVAGFSVPSRWPKGLARRWKVEVGAGHSSPVAVGNGVFVLARQGESEVVRRLDLSTGREVWRDRYAAPYEPNPAARAHGPGPKSTPVFHDGRLYTFGISGTLSCLDAGTGAVRWRHDFARQYKATSPQFGTAMSPVVDRGLLIAHVGGQDEGALTAFDAKNGRVRWRWSGEGPAYASPILVTLGGVRQVATQTQKSCVGVAAESGQLLWRVPFTTPYDQNSVTPVAIGELLVFGGVQRPTFACRVKRQGTGWAAEKAWETRDVSLYMSTPVASGSRLYGMSERRRGQLFSLDGATGKLEWTDDGRLGDNAALFDAGAVLLVMTTDATLRVFRKNGAALAEVARYVVAESPTWASPAFAGRGILVKDASTLALWEIPQPQRTQRAQRGG